MLNIATRDLVRLVFPGFAYVAEVGHNRKIWTRPNCDRQARTTRPLGNYVIARDYAGKYTGLFLIEA